MKANELMLNNFVERLVKNPQKGDPLYYYKTSKIDQQDFYYYDENIFRPILLTEDWLLKFGFEKIKLKTAIKGFYIIYYRSNDFVVYLLNDFFEVELIKQDGEQFNLFKTFNKEVHQLQNLYFALTNEELTIKNYEITEEQIKQLAKGNAKVKEWFPEVFETLIFKEGNWYYDKCNDWLFCYKGENRAFGFVGNVYSNDYSMCSTIGFEPATDSEVLEALTNEAKKRGYKKGVFINSFCLNNYQLTHVKLEQSNEWYNCEKGEFDKFGLRMGGACIYSNGQWAEIIKTYTKEEAEKLLNAKII